MDGRAEQIAAPEEELAALRKHNEDLTDFLENASVPMHWVGPDGRILWANQAELDLLGYSREEYVGRCIGEFHADAPVIEDILRRLMRRETLENYEARLRCKNGAIRHVLINSSGRWREDEFLHTRCITRDVTDRKRYEQRLLAQYGVGQVLAAASSLESAATKVLQVIAQQLDWQVGMLWNATEDGPDLCCTAQWDPISPDGDRFMALSREIRFPPGFGLPGRVWSGKVPAWITDLQQDRNFPRLTHAEARGLRSAFAFPIVLGGKVHSVMEFFAAEVRTPDDEQLRIAGSLGYQIGEFLERTRAQQRLAEREESYRVLAETASDGIVTVDARSVILFANSAAARIFGYKAGELIGSDLSVLMPEHLRTQYQAGISQYLEAGCREAHQQVLRVSGVHRDGYEIPVEISFGEYRQGSRHILVGVIRDITERNELDAKLRESAKLESLGVLAGGIAHDFNNLLTGILGNISLTLETLSETDPARETLENAIEASERAANLTKQLLAYAGKGRFVVERTDISALVREISTLIRSLIPRHVNLRLDLQEPLPQVDADVAQMQQLIMNLVINAAEAVPESRQGAVLVTTRSQEADAQYLAALGTTIPPGQYVVISVLDNGVGMDEATLARIFDPFFTTKFTGRGLGLAAVGGIVRGHNGAMKVFSSPGQGTTFRVLLPVSAAARSQPTREKAEAAPSGRGIILVVDDEPIVRKIATTSLSRYGYTTITANNGREGVDRFREWHLEIKVVLLDMTMPVMSGEEALEQMRTINPCVPVILSSGYNEVEAIRKFNGKGLAGFLQKPYTAAGLAEKIHAVLLDAQGAAAS